MQVDYVHLRYKGFMVVETQPDRYGCTTRYLKDIPHNMGGCTVAYYSYNEYVTRFAVAECSFKDNFCKATGREISYGRLLKAKDLDHKINKVSVRDFIDQLHAEWYGETDDIKYLVSVK